MTNLNALKDSLAITVFGQTRAEAQAEGLCIKCKEPALPKCYSAAGKEEYRISGLCEQCFDALMGGGD